MEKFNPDRYALKKFGLTMAAVFLAISLFMALRHRASPLVTVVISGIFFISAFISPAALKPIYISWFRFASILSWINTRIALLVVFYAVFAPVGLALRLLGVDLLDRKINKGRQSYWSAKDKVIFKPLDYERQF